MGFHQFIEPDAPTWPASFAPAPSLADKAKAACEHPSRLVRQLALSVVLQAFVGHPDEDYATTLAADAADGEPVCAEMLVDLCAALDRAEDDEPDRYERCERPWSGADMQRVYGGFR